VSAGSAGVPDEDSEPDWLRAVPAEARLASMRAHLEHERGEVKGESRAGELWNVCRNSIRGNAVRDYDAALRLVLEVYNPKCDPPYAPSEVARRVVKVYDDATDPPWGARFKAKKDRSDVENAWQATAPTTAAPQALAHDQGSLAVYGADLRAYLGADDPGDDEAAWLIRGVLAAGVPQVMAGSPKSRKTFLLEHMLICVAAGVDWLGQFKTTRSRVLLIPREDRERETRRRIWRLARGLGLDPRDLDEWLRVDSRTPFYFSEAADVTRMRRTIESWRPAIIAIDSLSRTHTGDENSKKEMSVVTSTWGDLCQLYDVSLALIHHLTKTGDGSLLQRLRGTGDLGALVRHLIGVEKKDATNSELSFDGNLPGVPDPFLVSMVDATTGDGKPCILLTHQGSAVSAARRRIRDEILGALKQSEPDGLTQSQLEKDITGKGTDIRAEVAALAEHGRIAKLGGNRWHLA
jgi:hypothetical protein